MAHYPPLTIPTASRSCRGTAGETRRGIRRSHRAGRADSGGEAQKEEEKGERGEGR